MTEQNTKGWIKLSRNITSHWLWTDEFSRGQAWVDLLIHASHSNNQKMMIKGEVVTWGRGQQIRSVKTLESSWKWSRSKVNRFLVLLEKEGMIERKGGHLTTIITICNYESFQGDKTLVDTSNGHQSIHQTDISRATNKNDKNVKNDKKDISQLIAEAWNDAFTDLPNVAKVSQKRKAHINSSIKEFKASHKLDDIERWVALFEYIKDSDFLMGRKAEWRCDFDFVINKNNLLKIIEGKYENANT